MKTPPSSPFTKSPLSADEISSAKVWRILRAAGLVLTAFLLTLLFVFQEMRHSRELYRMNQIVVETEVRLARLLELHRVEEAKNAELLSVLNTPQPHPEPKLVYATYALAMR